MKTTTVFLFLLFVAAAAGQPVISAGGVTNIASAAPDGLPNSGLAPGSIFVVNGTGLGAPNPTPLNLFQNATYPLPSSAGLNGTTIQLTPTPGQGPHPTVTAIMLYESPNMLAAILPSATQASLTYTVTVTYNGQTSAQAAVHVLARAFGQFTYAQIDGTPGIGYGPGLIEQQNSAGNFVVNRFNSPAVAGQTILLFGTGLGAVNGDESQGPTNGSIAGLTALDFAVYIGGRIATFAIGQDYIGRFISNGVSYAGVDIIEVQVPQNVQGCYVPVAVVAGGVTSNITTMSIDPSGTFCNDPIIGYSQADLQQIHDDQLARIGTVSVGSLKAQGPNGSIVHSDSVTAGFVNMTPQQFDTAPGAAPSAGGCTVTLVGPNSQPLSQSVLGTPIDAGPAINLNGPDGAQQIAQSAGQLSYAAISSTTTPLVDTGAFSFDNGGGGADVGSFQGSFNVPAAPQGIQGGSSQIPTNSNLVIGWSTADPNSMVEVIGVSGDPNTGLAAVFQCTAAASTKVIQIPSYVLSWLPTTNSSVGLLSVVTIGQTRFQAPGLEAGYFSYQIGDSAAVQFIPRSTNVKE